MLSNSLLKAITHTAITRKVSLANGNPSPSGCEKDLIPRNDTDSIGESKGFFPYSASGIKSVMAW